MLGIFYFDFYVDCCGLFLVVCCLGVLILFDKVVYISIEMI